MEFGTVSSVSINSQQDYQRLLKKMMLQKTLVLLKTYREEIFTSLGGVIMVKVTSNCRLLLWQVLDGFYNGRYGGPIEVSQTI